MGLGQFVTREQFARQQGGFLSPVVSQMRGLVVVRSTSVANKLWLANRYLPKVGQCTELEDRAGANITPQGADCDYCYPDVYLDRHRISSGRSAANVGQFHPDMLQAMEIYLGPAETPIRYASGLSSCGAIVFHTRVPDIKPRIAARRQDEPTRSRVMANVGISAARAGGQCLDCASGSAADVTIGYTLRDRWVVTGRYAKGTGNLTGPQSIELKQMLLEWYPRPDPGRLKWFINAGVGTMTASHFSETPEYTDRISGTNLPSVVGGTGMDIAVYRRFAITPFVSYSRTVGGDVENGRCLREIQPDGSVSSSCFVIDGQPRTFSLMQFGTRLGWR